MSPSKFAMQLLGFNPPPTTIGPNTKSIYQKLDVDTKKILQAAWRICIQET